jgi:hypothetical protein
VLAAIAAGGGPHTFACAGPTTIVTSAELVISQPLELDGGGLLTLSGAGTHRVIFIDLGAEPVVLRNLAFVDGRAPDIEPSGGALQDGGCIAARADLTLVNAEISDCEATAGGGVWADDPVTVIDSSIHDCSGVIGGGISSGIVVITRTRVYDNRASFFGGGVFIGSQGIVTESTLTRNEAELGGGIAVTSQFAGDLTVSRSTFAYNRALAGGGLYMMGAETAIDDSTFAANLPDSILDDYFEIPGFFPPPILVRIRGSTVIGTGTPTNAIVAAVGPKASDTTLENSIVVGSCSGGVVSEGGNVLSGCTTSLHPGDQLVPKQAINLGKLGDHGGPTPTIPLLVPSVAIDAAPGCTSATDQRGVTRPQGSGCDVGAFEWNGGQPVPALPPMGVALLAAALLALARGGARRR